MIIIYVLNVKEKSILKPIQTVFVISMETKYVHKIKMPFILDIHQKMMMHKPNHKVIMINLLMGIKKMMILHLNLKHFLQFHFALKEFYIAKTKKAINVINVVMDIHGIK